MVSILLTSTETVVDGFLINSFRQAASTPHLCTPNTCQIRVIPYTIWRIHPIVQ